MISLHGKTALITGASRGIGLAIAKAFAAQGASTILVARDPVRLRAAVAAVAAVQDAAAAAAADYAPPPAAAGAALPFSTGVAGDVAQPDTWRQLGRQVAAGAVGRRAPDRLDLLVNCAGIAQHRALAGEPDQRIAEILDTNLRGALLGCKYAVRWMMKSDLKVRSREQSIINVSSAMALGGGQGASVYAASKAGLLGLASALAIELSSLGIRVNTILPGYIETDMTKGLDNDRLRKIIPAKRVGTVEEVADAAVFLARNGYANNCALTLDGGLGAGPPSTGPGSYSMTDDPSDD